LKLTEISKLIGESWKNLDDVAKIKFHSMQIKDKERFDQETASLEKNGFFINKLGQNSKDLFKPVLGHDVVKPKKPLNAFMFYSISKQKEVREKNPTIPITEVS
jgi:hypothetical protein